MIHQSFPDGYKEENSEEIPYDTAKARLRYLFREIEKEFDRLHAENMELKHRLNISDVNVEIKKKKKDLRLSFDKVFRKKESSYDVKIGRQFFYHKDAIWDLKSFYDENEEIGFICSSGADCTVNICSEEHLHTPVLSYVGHTGSVNCVEYNPVEKVMCSASGDGTCHLWKLDLSDLALTEEEMVTLPQVSQFPKNNDSISDDLDTLDQDISDDEFVSPNKAKHESTLQQAQEKRKELTKKLCSLAHGNIVQGCCWLSDDKIATLSWDGKIRVFSANTGSVERLVSCKEPKRVTNIQYNQKSGTSKLIATCGKSGVVRLWDCNQLKTPTASIKVNNSEKPVNTIAFTRGGSAFLLTGDDGGNVKLWDLHNLKSPVRSINMRSEVNKISVFNGQCCVALTKPVVNVYTVSTGKLMVRIKSDIGHKKMITGCCFSKTPRRELLYSCSLDRRIVQWCYRKILFM